VALAVAIAFPLCSASFAHAAESSQPTKIWRIGYLGAGNPSSTANPSPTWGAFKEALQKRGYVEGTNLSFERRYAMTRADYQPLAQELARLNMDVIVVGSGTAAGAAKAATNTTPIVMAGVTDPVGQALVASLARPGGNVTGIADDQRNLTPKRLELLKAAVPSATRVASLIGNFGSFDAAKDLELGHENAAAAQALGIRLVSIRIDAPQDFENATIAILRERVDALSIADNPTNTILRENIAEFAIQHKLPAIAASRRDAVAGIMMTYGPDYIEIFRNAATYVDKILKGAKPGDLPIEQSSKYELIINLKTAEALGLSISQTLRYQATDVISK
jgi:putative ABC transport system substrate-binding protein